jgi:hypothetical protein
MSPAGILAGLQTLLCSFCKRNNFCQYAVAQAPTFFSLWIGNNDVLGYATTTGGINPITPSAGPAGAGFDAL